MAYAMGRRPMITSKPLKTTRKQSEQAKEIQDFFRHIKKIDVYTDSEGEAEIRIENCKENQL